MTGGISGRVTNSAGRGLSGICVAALSRGAFEGAAVTGPTGRYLLGDLGVGRYRLRFTSCSSRAHYFPLWYPSANSASTGRGVAVAVGRLVRGIDLVMSSPAVARSTGAQADTLADTRARLGAHARSRVSEVATGAIKGTVTDSTDTSLSGICVQAVAVGQSGSAYETTTGPGGFYTIAKLFPGTYVVTFSTCLGGNVNFAPQWSGGSATYSSAKGISVSSGSTTSGVNAKMQVGGSISGKVTSAAGTHLPISGVCVDANSQNGSTGFTSTAANGTYSIVGLPTGAYTVAFLPNCEVTPGYLPQWYRGTGDSGLADPVSVVVGEQTSSVDASLTLAGSIQGQVTDSTGTRAQSGVCVEALAASPGANGGSSITSKGGYSIMGLSAGTYVVEFLPTCGDTGNYLSQWYRDKSTSSSATKIRVTAGERTTGISARLQAGGTISGKVANSVSAGLRGICVSVFDKNPNANGSGSTVTTTGGTYSIPDLPTGDYLVEFMAGCGNAGNFGPQWYMGEPSQSTATPVAVTAGKRSSGIDARMRPGGTIAGKVTGSRSKPLSGICVSVSGANGFGNATTTAAGTYRIGNLGTGKYTVSFSPGCGSPDNFLNQWFDGQSSSAKADLVAVKAGDTTSGIDAKMLAGGTLTGTVTNANRPLLGMCVAVFGTAGGGSARTSITGSFTVSGLGTGKYIVEVSTTCASENLGNYASQSTPAARPIAVTAGKTTPPVDLKIAADGEISGTVTASSGGARLTGICVEAYSVSNSAFEVAITADGSYQMVGLAPGRYGIEFITGCGSTGTYATQWFRDKPSESSANRVLVSPGKDAGGVSAKLLA